MNLEEIVKKINNIKIGLVHHGFYDGWVIAGMKKELKRLQCYYSSYFTEKVCA